MTKYIVLEERGHPDDNDRSPYMVCGSVDAPNAEKACRIVAEDMADEDEDLAAGITLRAIPARNWASGRNTFAAKTERKLIRS